MFLIRLRLWLALLIMAVVPLVVASALLYAAVSSQALGQQYGALATSKTVSQSISDQLERIDRALRLLAVTGSLDELAAGEAGQPAAATGRASLQAATEVAGPALRAAWVTTAAGDRSTGLEGERWRSRRGSALASADHAAVLALAGGRTFVSAPYRDHAGTPLLATAVPLRGDSAVEGVLTFEVSISALLQQAWPAPEAGVGHVALVDSSGALLVAAGSTSSPDGADEVGLPPALESDPGQRSAVLAALAAQDQAAGASQWDRGWATASVEVASPTGSVPRWALISFYPLGDPILPTQVAVVVVMLGLALLLLALLMSRQVLRPAEELARSQDELHGLYQAARAASLGDALTGLGNHRAFQEELERQLEWYQRYDVPVALLLIDLDDLKLVNDSAGHAAGDEQLSDMGRLITEQIRYADRAFRIGGDEFAILMPHTDAEGALAIGRRLLARALSHRSRPIPFSGGVSACPALATTRSQLYAQADAALYWCKRHGRASLDIFDQARDHDATQQPDAGQTAKVARVVADGLFRAVYQPVVDLRNGAVIGYEGLIRPLPESGFESPGQLFAAAEACERIVELDHACIEAVIAHAQGLLPHQHLSANLSPRTIEAPHFRVEWLTELLERRGMDPSRIVIELTEHEGIEDLPHLQRNLVALQRAGMKVAIDDVGAGNSGLRLLSQFRFDIVKADLSLVQDGTRRDSSRDVLSTLRELAGKWGAYVVAEGIETVGQLRMVRELGLTAGQGYLLGRPVPAPSMARIDIAAIAAGGAVLDVALPPPNPAMPGVPAAQPGTP